MGSLEHATVEMKSNEKVVLAAVQQNGDSLCYASEAMRSNEKVVLAAIQQNADSLQHGSEDMKKRVTQIQHEWACTTKEAVQSLTESKGISVSCLKPSSGYAEAEMVVVCRDEAGNEVATLSLDPKVGSKELCTQVAQALGVPPPVLRIILPNGTALQDVGSAELLRALLEGL